MGSKKLKAISATGTGGVSLAYPDRITQLARAVAKVVHRRPPPALEALGQQLAAEGQGSACCEICTEACLTPCQPYLQNVPGVVYNDRRWSGAWVCAAPTVNRPVPIATGKPFRVAMTSQT